MTTRTYSKETGAVGECTIDRQTAADDFKGAFGTDIVAVTRTVFPARSSSQWY